MSKKLLIAVLTLGLLLTLSGAAFSSNTPKPSSALEPIQKINADAPRYNDLTEIPRHTPAFEKPAADLNPLTEQVSVLPPPYYCEFIDYSGGNAAYFWTIPDAYGDDYMNMRFTPAEGYACTLTTAYIAVYPSAFVGTPDMDVVVWDDDGFGYPGTELGRVNVPYSALPTAMAYAVVDMTSLGLVFTDGEEFHVGVTTTDQVNNVLAILSDDGSNGMLRSSESWNGLWGLMFDDWGVDVNFLIGVDICCADLPYSECYYQDYVCGVAYFWSQPDAYGDDYFNMRMSVDGPETLTAVDVALYGAETVGTPDLDVFVWGSSGGFPDLSNVIYSTTVPNASLLYFPNYEYVPVPGDIVLRSDFHVGWSTDDVSGGTLAGLSDDGSCGAMRSSEYWGVWGSMLDDWGVDVNFLIGAYMCKDEFSVCYTDAPYCGLAYFWRLPDVYGDIGNYQKFEPTGLGCRLEKYRVALYDNGDPDIYTYNSEVQVWSSDPVTGLPDTKLAGVTLTPADYVMYPGMVEVDFTSFNILFDEAIWVGIESFAPSEEFGIRTLSDDGSCGSLASCENWAGDFFYMLDDWGTDVNFVMEIDVCCVPPEERPCEADGPYGPDEDWVTAGHDFRRTAASDNTTGDAKCKQALSWMTSDLAGFVYGRPIIYDGRVFAPYNDKLQVFDINTGALLHTFAGLPEMGSSFRNSVTCKDGYVYFGGGNGRSFSKAELAGYTTVWSRNVLNNPFAGNTLYTTSVILDCGGTEVVFLTTATGELYALDASTGLNYTGWAVNPLMLDGDPLHTLSSNEVDVIYVGTDGGYGTGYGTLYAIDACTGAILWTLGEADLMGHDIDGDGDGTVTTELFQGPIGVDLDGDLYVQTAFNTEISGAPSAAVYRITSGGSIVWGKPFQFPRYTGPVIDANLVMHTGLRGWTSEGVNGTFGFKKTSGAEVWQSSEAFNAMNWVEGALSCEPLLPDLLYVGNMDAQFLVINADDGNVEFEYNYVDAGSNRGVGAAIDNSHVVFTNRQGDMYVFTEQVDRPRLRINTFDEFVSVPFFSPNGYIVTFDDVFMNNGCADLTFTLTPDEAAPAAYAWTVNPERIARMQKVADGMVDYTYEDMARNLVKRQAVDPSTLDAEFMESPYAKETYSNTGAYGPPAWLNNIVVSSGALAPGEAFSVEYNVNGPLVTRGPQRCYVTIATNDTYFLNSADNPVVQLGVLGGCLQSFDGLVFGVTEQNYAPVMNTGEIGTQNGDGLWSIDGNDGRYWQGGFFYAAEQGAALEPPYSLAWTTDSWHGGDPEDYWNSLLPDPNCFDQCEPYITPDPVLLGAINNGGVYEDIYGYVAAYSYIDSVIDFDCYLAGWDWTNIECPYSNDLTIGLKVNEFMYGVIGVDALDNVVIFRHDVSNRNADPITAHLGAFHDFDLDGSLNGFDLFKFDGAYGISYGSPCSPAYDFTNGVVYGVGKIPYDLDPMFGVRTMDANQAMWEASNIALDSMYYYMTAQPGQTAQTGIDMNFPCDPGSESDDRDMWASFGSHDFAGFEDYSFGTYFFGYEDGDVTDDAFFQDLAVLVNQFAGWGRGHMDGDGMLTLADVVALWNMVNAGGPGPLFQHLADVNADGNVDNGDVLYLANYYFCLGPAPVGDWALPNICP